MSDSIVNLANEFTTAHQSIFKKYSDDLKFLKDQILDVTGITLNNSNILKDNIQSILIQQQNSHNILNQHLIKFKRICVQSQVTILSDQDLLNLYSKNSFVGSFFLSKIELLHQINLNLIDLQVEVEAQRNITQKFLELISTFPERFLENPSNSLNNTQNYINYLSLQFSFLQGTTARISKEILNFHNLTALKF